MFKFRSVKLLTMLDFSAVTKRNNHLITCLSVCNLNNCQLNNNWTVEEWYWILNFRVDSQRKRKPKTRVSDHETIVLTIMLMNVQQLFNQLYNMQSRLSFFKIGNAQRLPKFDSELALARQNSSRPFDSTISKSLCNLKVLSFDALMLLMDFWCNGHRNLKCHKKQFTDISCRWPMYPQARD